MNFYYSVSFKHNLFLILADNVLALCLEDNDSRKFIQSSLTDFENHGLCAVLLRKA